MITGPLVQLHKSSSACLLFLTCRQEMGQAKEALWDSKRLSLRTIFYCPFSYRLLVEERWNKTHRHLVICPVNVRVDLRVFPVSQECMLTHGMHWDRSPSQRWHFSAAGSPTSLAPWFPNTSPQNVSWRNFGKITFSGIIPWRFWSSTSGLGSRIYIFQKLFWTKQPILAKTEHVATTTSAYSVGAQILSWAFTNSLPRWLYVFLNTYESQKLKS